MRVLQALVTEPTLPFMPPSWRRCALVPVFVVSLVLAGCGGGGGGGGGGGNGGDGSAAPSGPTPTAVAVEKPATRAEAARFLTQASFGPTDADIDRVLAVGYGAWIDEQFALPASSHRSYFQARDAEIKSVNASNSAGQDQVLESFWKQAVSGPDQLRQRSAYALSQIFVISMVDSSVAGDLRSVAAWMDMLGDQGLGTYRELLETVSRHPVMGAYLSHLRNQKADLRSGRVPDENYAREVIQLFSLGLVELNEDGSAKSVNGAAVETYGAADVSGLARVFTGWSWDCPSWPDNSCFFNGSVTTNGATNSEPDRGFKSMLGYPQYHSTEEKKFLGLTIAVQPQSDPTASLRRALDTLAAHPNVGPFIGRQLIQRLVTSNPSPTYVRDVARAFANNGSGVRGDMKAVIKAVLMHPEARVMNDTSGKVREPVLRLSAFLRAFPHKSDSGQFKVGNTDNPGTALGQSPLRAPSVFNYYRPGYVAPGTASASRSLVVPELQIAHETTAAGYVNYMRDNVASGVGQNNGTLAGVVLNRRDLQGDYSAELALATDPVALTERVVSRLTYTRAAALKTEISSTVALTAIPALVSSGTGNNQAAIDTARRTRVNIAVLLALASPEVMVQP